MTVVLSGLCPHPPIMVPEVGGAEAQKVAASQQAMRELGRLLRESGAKALIFITPHGPVFRDGLAVGVSENWQGDLASFRAPQVRFELPGHPVLGREICRCLDEAGIVNLPLSHENAAGWGVDLALDHGLTVPLYFLQKEGVTLPLVPVYMGLLPPLQLYRFGLAARQAAQKLDIKIALLASGDMSHRLTSGAPSGYHPRGAEFDHLVRDLLVQGDVPGLVFIDDQLRQAAGECGWRPLVMMLGALDGLCYTVPVLSYEGPFGVGYLVAGLKPGGPDEARLFSRRFDQMEKEAVQRRKAGEGYLPALARAALESHLRGQRYRVQPADVPEEFRRPAGVFVSLKKHGELRGCIGTIQPQQSSIAEEVIANAISAGTADPRFYPVSLAELDELDISVDVLQPAEPVSDKSQLDPKRYGVIVRCGHRSGLLLPDLEGVDSVEQQLGIALQKAGISPREKYTIERFEVVRYK
ncbi:AmmeMemoRadiSam system protein A [Desulfurispora thermophila]|uniref:AmmeMemoRadiSam system protein A n=1 Tax=Desulfurispora thermophila TaxID=265470 RepID=UPI00035D8B93|nr:AmmeMemoRadiSam system protein A [Desulfurispora thermophila]